MRASRAPTPAAAAAAACRAAAARPPRGRRQLPALPALPPPYNDLAGAPGTDPAITLLPGEALEGLGGASLALGEQTVDLPASARALTLILPADIDAVLDMYVDAGASHLDPYWARVWPAGVALADALLASRGGAAAAAGATVLDLGAGVGIAGIAAALAGAASVTVTDRDPLALACARRSAAANGASIATATLDWDDAPSLASAAADVVLAADVLYEAAAAAPVAAALAALVRPGGVALVADPATRAPAVRAAFAAELARGGRLVLESWTAVDAEGGVAAAGAPGATLLLTLRAPMGAGTLSTPRWP